MIIEKCVREKVYLDNVKLEFSNTGGKRQEQKGREAIEGTICSWQSVVTKSEA